MKKYFLIFFALISVLNTSIGQDFDLAIINASIFDTYSSNVKSHQTILIKGNTIVSILNKSKRFKAKRILDAENKLVTPGFIDTHIHLTMVYRDYEHTPNMHDSIDEFKQKFAKTYLPYGVTTVRVAGQPEKWIDSTLKWQIKPCSQIPDIIISGAGLISKEQRKPFVGHTVVANPQEASEKVMEYYNLGIRDIKLYWRLRYPEFISAYSKAKELNLNVFAHIEGNVSIDSAFNIGIRCFEHTSTIAANVFTNNKKLLDDFNSSYRTKFDSTNAFNYIAVTLEQFNYIKENKIDLQPLICKLGNEKVFYSSTLHLFADPLKVTYFTSEPRNAMHDFSIYNEQQTNRCKEGLSVFLSVVREMHHKGIRLTIGTDVIDGGKAYLSELLLLEKAGISPSDILKIATKNGAEALNRTNDYGSISEGKRANLIIFDDNPLISISNVLNRKTIIKGGEVYE